MANVKEAKRTLIAEKNSMKKKYKTIKELRDIFLIFLAVCMALSVYAFVSRAREREASFDKLDGELYRNPVALSGNENLSAMSYSFFFYRYYYGILESENFMMDYGAYGLDSSMALRECLYTSQRNWYDRLSEETTTLVKETMRYNSIAAKEGTKLGADEEKLISEELEQMSEKAKKENMSLDEYIGYRYCPDMTVDEVVTELRRYYLARKQYEITLDKLGTFTREELDDYYAANPLESLKGNENTPCVDMRMITLKDAASAEAVYKEAIAAPTEEAFTKLVMQNSMDDAIYYGGLYDDVVPGMMVDNVNKWLFAAERKSGDIGLFTENEVYCVIYYVSAGEESYLAYSRSELYDERVSEFYKKMEEDYPISENSATIDTVIPDYLATDYISVPAMFSVFFVICAVLALFMLVGAVVMALRAYRMKKQYGYTE